MIKLLAGLVILDICINISNYLNIKTVMTKQEKLDASLARLNAATNEIASDLTALRDEIKNTDTVSDESLATLDTNISKLEVLGQDPENPVPEPEPIPE